MVRAKPSAICEREELCRHRNSTRVGGRVMNAAGRRASLTGSSTGAG